MDNKWSTTTKYVMGVALFFAALAALYVIRPVWPLLILAALISFLLRPVIRFFHRRLRIKRGVAIVIAHILVILVLLALPLLLLPSVIRAVNFVAGLDFQAFADQLFTGLRDTLTGLRAAQVQVLGVNLSNQFITPLIDSLSAVPKINLPGPISYPTVLSSVGTALSSSLGLAVDLVGSAASSVIAFFLMIVASMYLSRDAHLLREGFLSSIPAPYRPEMTDLLNRLGAIWSNFLVGESLVMLIIGGLVALGGLALGLPGAIFLGIVAALLEIIPNLGPIIATIPALVVALLQGPTYLPVSHLQFTIIVLVFYLMVQLVENNVVVPFVLGDAVELHPLLVMIGSVVAFTRWGILGALLAAPVMASAKELARYTYGKIVELAPDATPQPAKRSNRAAWAAGLARIVRRERIDEDRPSVEPPDRG
jgi:predicted PurR-regulated permease PerM